MQIKQCMSPMTVCTQRAGCVIRIRIKKEGVPGAEYVVFGRLCVPFRVLAFPSV
jgi:hypothetical protein